MFLGSDAPVRKAVSKFDERQLILKMEAVITSDWETAQACYLYG